jgi:hypothetical protein
MPRSRMVELYIHYQDRLMASCLIKTSSGITNFGDGYSYAFLLRKPGHKFSYVPITTAILES